MCSFLRYVLLFSAFLYAPTSVSAQRGVCEILNDLWGTSYSFLNGLTARDGDYGRMMSVNDNMVWCFCGNTSWLDSFFRKNNDTVAKCNATYPSQMNTNTGVQNMWNQIMDAAQQNLCTYDCIFRGAKLLTQKGKLHKTLTKRYFMNNVFNEDWMKNISGNVVDKCLDDKVSGLEILGEYLFSFANNTTCSAEPSKFLLCLMLEMTDSCPEDHLNQAVACQFFYFGLNISKGLLTNMN